MMTNTETKAARIVGYEVWARGKLIATYGPEKGHIASRRVDTIDNAHGSYIARRKAIWAEG